jgi:hypothetical protein
LLSAIAMRRALAIAFASAFLVCGVAPDVRALPDSATSEPPEPSDERAGMCDAFDGLAFTFCVALCEARECDLLDAADARCALLRNGFATVSGGGAPPCTAAAGSPTPGSVRTL